MIPDPGHETLPPLFAKWTGELLGGPISRETKATCASCAMAVTPNRAAPETPTGTDGYYFDAVIKCCTYQPTLYNFLVGQVLSDQDPAAAGGRATVEQRLAAAAGVTPLGLMQTPTYALLYNHTKLSFGRSRTLKCPHYIEDGGRCGVWTARESTCATWFCKHVKGSTGYAFWRDGLHSLLQTVEIGLARWCVLELGVSDAMLKDAMASKAWRAEADPVTGDALDGRIDAEAYAKTWAEWRGREQEFFVRCAELVEPLSWQDVLTICGPDARGHAQLTITAYQRLMTGAVPANPKVGAFEVMAVERDNTRLRTYSEYDPLDVPNMVMELLPYFDGRPTAEILAAIAEERGVALGPDLIQKMVDFDLLVAAKT